MNNPGPLAFLIFSDPIMPTGDSRVILLEVKYGNDYRKDGSHL